MDRGVSFGQFTAPILVIAIQARIGGLENVLMLFSVFSIIGAGLAVLKLKGAHGLVTHKLNQS